MMAEKRRKATSTKRKEEISDLKVEVRKLRSELELKADLKALQTPVKPVERVVSENKTLSSAIQQQQLDVARVHSTLPPPLVPCGTVELHPLCTRICLKKSWDERSATLLSLRAQKFRAAYEYITTRSRQSSSYSSDERFETASGDVCCSIFQTVHFPGVKSLEQVYDAVLFSMNNVEISICERLGHLTTRDDYDCADSDIYNARMVSTNDMGITTEVSGIMFSRFFDSTDTSFAGAPCGMLVVDSVDEDELYPYVPSERVRKDVSAAFVLTVDHPQAEDDELVVTLRRAAFVKLHYPAFDMSEAVWQELQQNVVSVSLTPQTYTTSVELRDEQLHNAYQYVAARSEFATSGPTQVSVEQFTTAAGDVCCAGFESIEFGGVQSIQQVFEALGNIGISTSERLGHITVRDDYDGMQESGFNGRVLPTDSFGLTTETNGVGFSHIFGEGELGDFLR
ncbi:hypothetical protein PHYPSEUDO_011545 [Phytophthora pseudosyringae]|uniref:Uncharacterized protein n=1 Tax=Phytophthora pseudosyringae TaxID=221518 RepID=A0A8T1V8X9_9STRA|nr:hypothetical protein PHYPSEUDO_011545 [Phytophthora pseudosyringae]